MFTAIILMCSLDSCYTITNETGFFTSEIECQQGVYDLLNDKNFSAVYQYLNDGKKYDVLDVRCINWDADKV